MILKFPSLIFLFFVLFASNVDAQARVQIIHNSADLAASEVDIYVSGIRLIDDFPFRAASPFTNVTAGIPLTLQVAPGNSTSAADAVYNKTIIFEAGKTYILVADGNISDTGYVTTENFGIEVYDQGREGAASVSNTDILVHHGVTDAPAVDVNEVTGPAVLVNDASYTDFAGYLELPTADYKINVTTADGATVLKAYDVPLALLELEGVALTVLASGFLDPSMNSNGESFGLYAALPIGGPLVPLPETDQPNQLARVQIIHNSADLATAEVDVYINGALASDNFAFRTATPFINVPSGIGLTLQVAPSNSTTAADAFYETRITFEADETYVIVADGNISETGYVLTENFDLEVYNMGREAATTATNTDILVHHGVTDAPAVDINEVTGPSILVDNASYTDFAGYLELPTADYSINVTTADGATVLKAYDASLSSIGLDGTAITVVASGFLDPTMNSNGPAFGLWAAFASGGPLVALPETLPSTTARVQVIHNSADLAATVVDVYLNDELLIEDFAFRTASPFVNVPAGPVLEVKIAPSNSTSSADAIFAQSLGVWTADETYVLVADGIVSPTGYLPAQPFGLEVYPLGRETAATTGNTDVLVHHGSTDAPTVDVNEVTGPAVLVDNASYKDFAGYLELPTADYIINVSGANGSPVVEEYTAPLATLGLTDAAITVVASGFLDPTVNSNGPAFGLWAALASGGALVELPTATLSNDEFELQGISVYPNPANDRININFSEAQNTSVNMFDMLGRTVKTTSLFNTRNTIDVSNLNSGMYLIQLSNESGSKMIKLRVH